MAALIPTKKIPQLTDYGAELNGNEQLEIWVVNTSRRVVSRLFVLPMDALVTAVDSSSTIPGARHLADSPTATIQDNGQGESIQVNVTGVAALPNGRTVFVSPGAPLHDFALPATVGYLDIDTTAGATDLTGVVAPLDGFVLIVSNIGANLLQLMALNGGSAAANQFRLPYDMAVVQNGSMALRYSAAIGKWVQFT